MFQMFYKMVQTQFNTTIKIVRSDNGGEYVFGNLKTNFREQGLMLDTHVPKSYWGDALRTTTYLINRMPSRILDFKTPLEVLSLPFSTLKGISPKVFGCVCFIHIHGHTRSKLDPRSFKCVFVGYSPTHKG
jgi:hypothetical protein